MVEIVPTANTNSVLFLVGWFSSINGIISIYNENEISASNAYITSTFARSNYVTSTYAQIGYVYNLLNTLSDTATYNADINLKIGNSYFNTTLSSYLANTTLTSSFVKTSYILTNFQSKDSANTSYAKKSNNLSDLSNTSIALTNLGGGSTWEKIITTTNPAEVRLMIGYLG